MLDSPLARMRPALMLIGAIAIFAVGANESPANAQSRKHREDARKCASFGARHGAPEYTNCMLEQQNRRDSKVRDDLEKMAITSQIARDGQIMAERARGPLVTTGPISRV